MHAKNLKYIIILLVISFPTMVFATPPMPARIGGKIFVNGTQLKQKNSSSYTVVVTKQDGTALIPAAQDLDGLNASNFYIIDVPIYSAAEQPGGISPGEVAKIQIYKDGKTMQMSSPANGSFTVGESGTTRQININVMVASPQAALLLLLD